QVPLFHNSCGFLEVFGHRKAVSTVRPVHFNLYSAFLIDCDLHFLHFHIFSSFYQVSPCTGASFFTSMPVTRSRAVTRSCFSRSSVNVSSNRGSPFSAGGSAASSVGVRSFAKSGLLPVPASPGGMARRIPPAGSDTSSRAGACASGELLISNRGMPRRVWPSYAALMVIRATWPALGYRAPLRTRNRYRCSRLLESQYRSA